MDQSRPEIREVRTNKLFSRHSRFKRFKYSRAFCNVFNGRDALRGRYTAGATFGIRNPPNTSAETNDFRLMKQLRMAAGS